MKHKKKSQVVKEESSVEYNDYLSDIEQWRDMWDELSGEFIDTTPPEPYHMDNLDHSDYGDSPQDTYWDYQDEQLIQESKSRKSPNPIYPDTVGPDHELDAAWVNEELLSEIESLKIKLHELEDKLARKMGGDHKWVEGSHKPDLSKVQKEIDSIKKKINNVSDTLGIED